MVGHEGLEGPPGLALSTAITCTHNASCLHDAIFRCHCKGVRPLSAVNCVQPYTVGLLLAALLRMARIAQQIHAAPAVSNTTPLSTGWRPGAVMLKWWEVGQNSAQLSLSEPCPEMTAVMTARVAVRGVVTSTTARSLYVPSKVPPCRCQGARCCGGSMKKASCDVCFECAGAGMQRMRPLSHLEHMFLGSHLKQGDRGQGNQGVPHVLFRQAHRSGHRHRRRRRAGRHGRLLLLLQSA